MGSKKRGIGLRGFGKTRQIVIVFPGEMFQCIRERAVKAETGFAEQARLLIKWGLEAEAQAIKREGMRQVQVGQITDWP